MELVGQTAVDLLAMLEAKQTSAVEVMQATLAQIDTINGPVNAIVSLRDQEVLLAEAAQADAAPRRGVLHGLPMGH